MELAGKVVLVTGGAVRLGRAMVEELGSAGARVAIHYHTSADEAERAVAELAERGIEAAAFGADLRDVSATERLIEQVATRFGRLDGLVNSAARFYETRLPNVEEAAFDDLMAANLKAPFFLSQAAYRVMRQNDGPERGVIVNLADVGGWLPWPSYAVYGLTKAGVVMLTKTLAKAWGADGVRVNAVAPGAILPPSDGNAAGLEQTIQRSALGHIGEAADIARAVRFLFESLFITGHILTVDGGRQLSG